MSLRNYEKYQPLFVIAQFDFVQELISLCIFSFRKGAIYKVTDYTWITFFKFNLFDYKQFDVAHKKCK